MTFEVGQVVYWKAKPFAPMTVKAVNGSDVACRLQDMSEVTFNAAELANSAPRRQAATVGVYRSRAR